MKNRLLVLTLSVCFFSCNAPEKTNEVQNYMVDHAVIAHRGTIYWAPELTEAAFRWARNTGADYVELDVRYSKDQVMVIMHDATFNRTTDVAVKFPGREKDPVESFTFEEIMQLDAGIRFNENRPDQAREGFIGQDVLVMEDVFRIAEGKRIKRDAGGKRIFRKDASGKYIFEYENDPADNGNRPGVYIETKSPEKYAGIEAGIRRLLADIGWNVDDRVGKDEPFYRDGKVNVGNTRGKILVQTFSREGMTAFHEVFKGKVLCSFLVGTKNDFSTNESMDEMIRFAEASGAQFIGSNLGDGKKDGMPASFSDRLRKAGLKANVYSFDTVEQMEKYFGPATGAGARPLIDGMITNRSDLTLDFYHDKGVRSQGKCGDPVEILQVLGY